MHPSSSCPDKLRRNETINAKMRDERIKAQIEEAVARVMPPPPPKPVSRIVFDVSPESVSHPKGQLSVRTKKFRVILSSYNRAIKLTLLSAAENGAIHLYREYMKHYDRAQIDESSPPTREKKKKYEFDEPLELKLKQLRPLFDCEISRRPVLKVTPEQTTNKPRLLLSLPIPAMNSIAANRNSKTTMPSYEKMDLNLPIMLSWLLSLVDFDNSREKSISPKAPFTVIGLQQMTRNNLSFLYVIIQSAEEANLAETRQKSKKRKSEFDEFVVRVKRFLASVKLGEVAPWAWENTSPIKHLLAETEHDLCDKALSHLINVNGDKNAAENITKENYGFEWAQIIPQNGLGIQHKPVSSNLLNFENCFGLIMGDAFSLGHAVLEMLIKVNMYCLDICGLRLCWLTREEYNTATISQTFVHKAELNRTVPCLAVCTRGYNALQLWQSVVGPRNHRIAQFTDIHSLSGVYGKQVLDQAISLSPTSSPESCIFYSPRSNERSLELLIQFFGGGVTDEQLEAVDASKIGRLQINQGRSALLTAAGHQSLICTLSPRLPVRFLSDSINTIQSAGFQIESLRRQCLSEKQLKLLDEESRLWDSSDLKQPAIVIEISRENAVHHIAGLMNRLQEEMLAPILSGYKAGELHSLLYSTISIRPLSAEIQRVLYVKNPAPSFERWQPQPWDENLAGGIYPIEQSCCLVIAGAPDLCALGLITMELLHGGGLMDLSNTDDTVYSPYSSANGFEMIGIRLFEALSHFQAREICPVECGDDNYKDKMTSLFGQPACCLVLRRLAAVSILVEYRDKLKLERELDVIVTHSAPWTHRVIQACFSKSELCLDGAARAKYAPTRPDSVSVEKALFDQQLEVFAAPLLIPPRLHRQLPLVLKRLDELNLKLLSLRLFPQLEEEQTELLIPPGVIGRDDYEWMNNAYKRIWQSGPVNLIVVEGVDVIRLLNIYFVDEDFSGDFDHIDTIWVPESYNQSQLALHKYCPAGIDESAVDFDVSLNAASLNTFTDGDDQYGETVLISFNLSESILIFDKLKRSNFNILGLRTARLSAKALSVIFDDEIKQSDGAESEAMLFCVVMRRCCIEILNALTLPIRYKSPSVTRAKEQIPTLFAELLVL